MARFNFTAMEVLLYCSVLLVAVSLIKSASANDDLDEMKSKRAGGNMGLFPFPRVGRSDPDLQNWDLNSFEDYNDMYRNEMVKRQGLIPFPRVGRSGYKSPQGPAVSGMWFGPRLGRIQKRSSADQTVFTPRLGRELALLMGVEAIISPQLLLDDDVFVNLPTYFKRVHFV